MIASCQLWPDSGTLGFLNTGLIWFTWLVWLGLLVSGSVFIWNEIGYMRELRALRQSKRNTQSQMKKPPLETRAGEKLGWK